MFKRILRSIDPAHGAAVIFQERIQTKSSSLKIGASLRLIDGEKKVVITTLSSDGEKNVVFDDDEIRRLVACLNRCLETKQG